MLATTCVITLTDISLSLYVQITLSESAVQYSSSAVSTAFLKSTNT